ncbi:MAG: class I SAM-dependent methyltransferase [Solirubrobacterales bacterium]
MISVPYLRRGPDSISPTAHYTGETWVRHGLSHPELRTARGRVFFDTLRPTMAVSRALGGPTLEGMLIARHRIIDSLLENDIADGTISQVVEVACGMSPRGWRFATRHGEDLVYVEADLPAMAASKRGALRRIGSLSDRHRVVDLDVLRDGGPGSFAELIAGLDPDRGTAIITEGLTSYLSDEQVEEVWTRFADALHGFPAGLYLSDLRLAGEGRDLVEQVFNAGLGAFVRSKIHPHFSSEDAAAAALVAAGFETARLHRGDVHPAAELSGDAGAALIHVIEGRIGSPVTGSGATAAR